jgi:uncharacterized phage-associated protein
MARIEDVASYVLDRLGQITAMKLQKLCYYAQAWNLVWEDRPLFDARIEAWANGPVIPELYRLHAGRLNLASGDLTGSGSALTLEERETVDVVLEFYGSMTAHQLSELTHREEPWRQAREAAGLSPMERGRVEITQAAMHEFYLDLATAEVE